MIKGIALALILSVSTVLAAYERGPDRGTLVIVGGNMQDPTIVKRFIDLAGGPDAPIVIIPTAGEDDDYDNYWTGLKLWRENGAKNLTVIHTRDRKVANSDAFVQPIRDPRGVFFAGASILTSFMVRGDTKSNEKMIGDHTVGFGFLKNAAVDQHLLRRNRQFEMIEVIDAHPELLGIGLDEDIAIVIEGDQFDVIGRSYAVIYSNKPIAGANGRLYFMGARVASATGSPAARLKAGPPDRCCFPTGVFSRQELLPV